MRNRVVTMCQGGHVRSVALKYLLRYKFGVPDVIACGWEGNTPETRRMLVIMQKHFTKYVPDEFHDNSDGTRRLFCYDVGEDRFMNPFHPELQAMLDAMIRNHGALIS